MFNIDDGSLPSKSSADGISAKLSIHTPFEAEAELWAFGEGIGLTLNRETRRMRRIIDDRALVVDLWDEVVVQKSSQALYFRIF